MIALAFSALVLLLPTHTPGAYNPAVKPATIQKTICVPGYSTNIRPPVSYTSALKITQLRDWSYADQQPSHYEEDHFIPLSLGGAPKDPRNLWPEPDAQAEKSDPLEYQLYKDVCSGLIALRPAQKLMIAWKRVYG